MSDIVTDEMLNDLAKRMVQQHDALTANGADFTYDRNGLRLGIAAVEDEARELHDSWTVGKRSLEHPAHLAAIRHEVLDIAAAAMLIYRNIPPFPLEARIGEPPPHEPADVWEAREPA